jgi:hypothetical protein
VIEPFDAACEDAAEFVERMRVAAPPPARFFSLIGLASGQKKSGWDKARSSVVAIAAKGDGGGTALLKSRKERSFSMRSKLSRPKLPAAKANDDGGIWRPSAEHAVREEAERGGGVDCCC